MSNEKKSGAGKWVAVAALTGCLFIPGVDLLAAPVLVAVLASMAGGGKK